MDLIVMTRSFLGEYIQALLDNVEEKIILGGDFNTILDNRHGVVNIDKSGGGIIPNIENSREINKWVNEWRVVDPFRVRYPDVVEYSYMSFRRNDEFGKSRLDFFLVDKTILGWVKNVWYEDKLGRDFDHKEVTLRLGGIAEKRNETIYKGTTSDIRAKYVGKCALYDILNEHLVEPIENVRIRLGAIEQTVKQISCIYNANEGVLSEEVNLEIEEKEMEIEEILGDMPDIANFLELGFTCDFRTIYEVLIMGIKNRLMGIQVNNKSRETREKRQLQEMKRMYEELEGKNSEGWKRCNDEILELNDRDLKRRAGKYREFFEQNNEKPTGFFFNLGKEKDGDDNTQRIKNDNGDKFVNSKQRGEYIRGYYENLYKKRMDRDYLK